MKLRKPVSEKKDQHEEIKKMQTDSDRIDITYEMMDPSEIPPLDDHAEAILAAMREAGEPLSRRQLLRRAGVPGSAWSDSMGRLMIHDLVEIEFCKRRGDVYQCKGAAKRRASDLPKPQETKPLPPPESVPFFDMEDEIDWHSTDSDE